MRHYTTAVERRESPESQAIQVTRTIIKRHYERLIQKGKPGKVAVIAAARKLLTIAWACVKYERMFDPEYEVRGGRGKNEGDEES